MKTLKLINTWNSLPENVVDFSSLPRFRRSIQKVDFCSTVSQKTTSSQYWLNRSQEPPGCFQNVRFSVQQCALSDLFNSPRWLYLYYVRLVSVKFRGSRGRLGEVSGKSWTSRGSSCNGIWPIPCRLFSYWCQKLSAINTHTIILTTVNITPHVLRVK